MVGAAEKVCRCCCEFILDGWCSRECVDVAVSLF